ncbi:hypothetical protein NP233_g2050 [Leucocoprinus birnbaumii]|uniref:Small ribosomal subunit protein mS23 n=1 Tax=Leucocoprinus birnbaumii TaxID=56174 RepID=A0AAD5W2Z9_9AGAR|nr:hypothetical protein NP233_g2050 [Leucocoprinus birnbaumii]
MEFRVDEPEPYIPDHLSLPQFVFDTTVVPRPRRLTETPYFIEDATGRGIFEAEAKHRTYALAKALQHKWGISKDDVVCIFSPNDIDYGVAIWAVHLVGGIVTPGNPSYTTDELAHQIKLTKSALIIAHPACQKTVLAAAKATGVPDSRVIFIRDGPHGHVWTFDSLIAFGESSSGGLAERRFSNGEARDALAFLSLSSGTTGKPKAVAISHFAVIANILQTVAHWKINDSSWPNKFMCPGDVAIGVLPFFHIYGLVMNVRLFCGMSVVVIPKFNFATFLESIVRYHVTNLYLVPPQIVLLCKSDATRNYDLSRVKFLMSGAAPLSGELVASLRQILPNAAIGQGYGLTEGTGSVCLAPPEVKDVTVGSSGRLLPGVKARVLKSDGTLAGEGEQGELMITGPSMASYYLDNPQATKETFIDFWVRTGDEVIFRNNEIFIVDRLKEILKVKGFQVTPAELEGHLLLHPDVADSCVVSLPDDYSGELPLAYVVLQPHAAARIKGNFRATQELKQALFKHVADVKVKYKWLTGGIEFIDTIPKNPSGKIRRVRVHRLHRSLAFLPTAMVRRFANQVHQQVSRLMRADFTKEPVWYKAVLQYPPLPLPPRAPPPRTEYDNRTPKPVFLPGQRMNLRKPKLRPLPVHYIEDDIRRQFFRDHPFEAFRPRTLVEGAEIEPEHATTGQAWTRLRQRGRNPTPEDAIRFAMNLHQHHNLSLSEAYLRAVAQFRALRSEHHIATTYAALEAETFGSVFGGTEIQKMHEKELKVLDSWKQEEQLDESALVAKKRWKAIVEQNAGENEWTKGEEYVRLWKANIEPEFAPHLTDPIAEAPVNPSSHEQTQAPLENADVHVTTPRQ